jgi:hypothetical protein
LIFVYHDHVAGDGGCVEEEVLAAFAAFWGAERYAARFRGKYRRSARYVESRKE